MSNPRIFMMPSEPMPTPWFTDLFGWCSKNSLHSTIGRKVCNSSAFVKGWLWSGVDASSSRMKSTTMIPFGPFCAESVMNTISSRCRVVDQSTRHWGKWSVEPRSVGRESSWLPDPSSDQCRPISARGNQSAGTAGCSVENARLKQNRAKFTISSSISS
jgi:hypothetical protein